ncbi:MAG TPA: 16S rRNA (cytidine(1402)-2'-O)-methyltransferase [Gemmatimonadales bacterium]|nr:16S rRNA (cytidine(1402)-2'-O)-methyltransferase [Gemmatimonadales bacterium]
MSGSGTLFVVATPLGHLDDLTARAAALLRLVPVVAAEDTRRTRILLTHLGAQPRVLSFHAHSPARRREVLLEILEQGEDVALVSDAGTPGISDPGADLVAAARAAGVRIVPIPGVSAVTAALSVAGVPADRFVFLGFLPRKGKQRKRLLDQATRSEWPVVLYEAPPRLVDLLEDLKAAGAGDERRVLVARELTKLHEEVRDGALSQVIDHFRQHPPRGELTIVLWPAPSGQPEAEVPDPSGVARKLLGRGMTRRAAAAELVKLTGLPRNEAYRMVLELE